MSMDVETPELIDVVVLITPDGNWGARKLEDGEHQADVLKRMVDAWKDSVSEPEREATGNAGPTAVLQKMTPEGYHRIGAQYGHWVNNT